MYESCIPSRLPPTQIQNIITKLYLPHSRTFCLKEAIPFHFVVECKSARTLAAYLPYGPTPDLVGAMSLMGMGRGSSSKRATEVKVVRQAMIDVR
jgi:hypothetical protein